MHEDHESHGHSVAAWAGTIIMLVGSAVASLGVAQASVAVSVIGGVIFLIGAIAWPVLNRMGYGDKNAPRSLYT